MKRTAPGPGRTAVAAAAVLAAVGAPPAEAAVRADGRLAEVVAPKQDGAVRARSVAVRVRVRRSVRSFSAHVGRRDVSRRFRRRAGGRMRVAKLAVGRATGVRFGLNRLEIRVRDRRGAGDYEVVRFALVRRAPKLLRIGGPRRTARTARVRLRLARRRATVRLWLNGRRVPVPASARPGARLRRLRLTADEGLRHGRNVLRVVAIDRAGGRLAVRRRAIVMKRIAPIPGAGRNRRVETRRRVKLDGRATRAAHRPPSLRYRWRIVRKPRGSKAKLRRARSARPHLVPDLPGRYRLRMTVRERIPRGASASAVAAADDSIMVLAAPDDDGLGVPIQTMDTSGAGVGVKVGDQRYLPPDSSQPLHLLVLDRVTLEPLSNISFAGDQQGTTSLDAKVSGLANDTIAIITTPRLGAVAPVADEDALDYLNSAVEDIGGGAIPGSVAQSSRACQAAGGVCSGFSVIGSPGFAPGESPINAGLGALHGDGPGGALSGYLQHDQTGTLHTFVQGDHVPFDTTAGDSPSTQAAIKVGAKTYSSQVLPAPQAGAYVLVLDAGTLAFREDGTFPLRYVDVTAVATNLQAMDALLSKYRDDPSALVFVQAIGPVSRWDFYQGNIDAAVNWNAVGGSLQALGSHRTIWNALVPPDTDAHSYAQVSPGGSSGRWAKVASTCLVRAPVPCGSTARSAGQLAGTLARNDSSQFHADNAASSDGYDDELTLLAYQPATEWPLRGDASHRAALRCVAANLRVGTRQLEYPVEDNYTDTTLKLSWGNLQDDLDELTYRGLTGCDTSGFDKGDLSDVQTQLDAEFTSVPVVWGLIDDLQQPYQNQSPEDTLRVIADDINGSITQAGGDVGGDVEYDAAEGITDETFKVFGAVAALSGQEELAVGFELLSAGLSITSDSVLASDGTPALAPTVSKVDVDRFAEDLHDRYAKAIGHLDLIGAILVSDWGKLQTAAGNAAPGGPWAWNPQTQGGGVIDGIALSTRRFAYGVLFPNAYGGLVRATRGSSTNDLPDDPTRYNCNWQGGGVSGNGSPLFGHAPPWTYLSIAVNAGVPEREFWVFARDDFSQRNPFQGYAGHPRLDISWFPQNPSSDLGEEMFRDAAPELGIPPLGQLEFVLSIRDQLRLVTLAHDTVDGTADTCVGDVTGPPADLYHVPPL